MQAEIGDRDDDVRDEDDSRDRPFAASVPRHPLFRSPDHPRQMLSGSGGGNRAHAADLVRLAERRYEHVPSPR